MALPNFGTAVGEPWLGIPIFYSEYVRDGAVMLISDPTKIGYSAVTVGTGEWSESDKITELALRIVRNGLADVLAYLGEDVGPPVDAPMPVFTHVEWMVHLRAQAVGTMLQ